MSSPSVKVFETRLDEVWKNQPVRFDYKEELQLWCNDLDIEDDGPASSISMMMMIDDGDD